MRHYPVMMPEVLAALNMQEGQICLDGTFGNGGYSQAILETAPCDVIALDRDPNTAPRRKVFEQNYGPRFKFIQTAFSKMDQLDLPPLDAIVLDIGVSSMQIDEAQRGFSFMRDGPLDMRMAQSGPSASDAIMHLDMQELTQIFRHYGEEKRAKYIASKVVEARDMATVDTTLALAQIAEDALGRRGKTHPATRIFQALRIFINDELGELYRGLCAAETLLKPGGRLVVVTFHSLEDRIVKSFLRLRCGDVPSGSRHLPPRAVVLNAASFTLDKRSVTKPSAGEVVQNPRSRSAKLRAAIRTSAARQNYDERLLPQGLPSLADLQARL